MVVRNPLRAPPPLSPDAAVLLDFDGTLVELAGKPDTVVVDEALKALLRDLIARLSGRIAIVSGRSIAQLGSFLGDIANEISLIGSHGAETRHLSAVLADEARPMVLDHAAALFRGVFGARSGIVIEEKTLGVAIHYRLAPAAGLEARLLATTFARERGLGVQEGKMMVEVRLPGQDKGGAITELLHEVRFAGHMPFFVGDDLTDESGFAACEVQGGAGILVGPRRPTAARFYLEDVASVRRWLAQS